MKNISHKIVPYLFTAASLVVGGNVSAQSDKINTQQEVANILKDKIYGIEEIPDDTLQHIYAYIRHMSDSLPQSDYNKYTTTYNIDQLPVSTSFKERIMKYKQKNNVLPPLLVKYDVIGGIQKKNWIEELSYSFSKKNNIISITVGGNKTFYKKFAAKTKDDGFVKGGEEEYKAFYQAIEFHDEHIKEDIVLRNGNAYKGNTIMSLGENIAFTKYILALLEQELEYRTEALKK